MFATVSDSYGIGELVRSDSVIRHMAGEMKLVGVNERVSEVLRVSRFNTENA